MARPRAYGPLPRNTPIGELGVTKAQLAKLTPAARKLTKGDLIALDKWNSAGGKGPAPDHLTVRDLSSLRKAFPPRKAKRGEFRAQDFDIDVSCCSTPCCCCAVSEKYPDQRVD